MQDTTAGMSKITILPSIVILMFVVAASSNILSVIFFKSNFRYIDMAESLCQKRALEAFRLDPAKWGGNISDLNSII